MIFLTVHILCGFLRRITIPVDLNIRSNGGYEETWNEVVFVRNPAAPSYIQFFPVLLSLFNCAHGVHQASNEQSPYGFLMMMTDAEKAVYLQHQETNDESNSVSLSRKTVVQLNAYQRRLHNRFSSFLDRLEILIGTYFSLKPDIYKLPDALNLIGKNLFSWLDYLPDFRLRNIIRYCFIPFVRHCPSQMMMTTILEALLPFMYNKLKSKWKIITERRTIKVTNENGHRPEDDDQQDQDQCEEEVIEEQVRFQFDLS